MSTIVTRAGKGSALTHNEVDANFTNLNTDKLEAATSATLTNKTIALGSNTVSGTIAQFNTAVTDADLATLAGLETLTNKTISGASNTLSNIAQSSVTNLVTDLAAKAPLTPTVENIAIGSAYTLVAADNGKIKRGVDAAAQTINITTAFNGLSCTIEWLAGSGTITLDANAGVNLNGLGDGVNIVLSQAAGTVSIIPTGTNTWDVVGAIGDLVASDITNLGTGVATALTTNVGSAGAVVTNGGALGTPSSGTLTNCTGLPVAGGGTGASTLTANNVILGNGTSAVQFVAPSTSGNVLTSNGTTWTSAAPTGGSAVNFADGATWCILPQGRGVSGFTNVGMGAPTNLGTASGIFGDFNSDDGYHYRVLLTSTAATGSSAGIHIAAGNGVVPPGASTRHPVIKFKTVWANADAQTGARGGAGMAANGGAPSASAEPSAMVNAIFMGYDTGETQYSLMHNDGAGTCTKITLNGGTGFPVNDNQTKLFSLSLSFYPGAGDTRRIEYVCTNITDAITVSGSVVASATGGIPADNSVMQPFIYRNTSAGSTAVACVVVGMYGGGFSGL